MSESTLSARNFKGQTFEHELAPVTIFSGRNWKGKSARLEALSLALLGYVPGYSKRPSDLFGLFASGSEMSVSLGASTRSWREVRGAVKYSGPAINESGSVMLDPSVYFDLSGPARNRYLFSASGAAASLDGETLAAMIRANLKNMKLSDNSAASELAIDAISSILPPATGDVQEWLEGLAEKARERKKQTAASAKILAKTLQGLVLSGAQTVVPQNTEAHLSAAKAKLKELVERSASVGALLNQTRGKYKELSLKAALLTDSDERVKIESDLIAQRELLSTGDVPPLPESSLKRANGTLETLDRLKHSLSDLETLLTITEVENVAFEKSSSENLRVTILGLNKELSETEKEFVCSSCGQSLPEVRKAFALDYLRKRIADTKKEENGFWNKVVAFEKEHKKKLKTVKAQITEAKKEVAAAQCEHGIAQAEADVISKRYHDHANRLQQLVGINAQLADIAKARSNESDARSAADALPGLRAEGEKLSEEKESLEAASINVNNELCTAEAEHKGFLEHKARLASRERAKAAADKSDIEAEVAKQFSAMLDALQAKLVEDSIRPLVTTINELCKPILPAAVSFLDGELVLGGHSHKTASDSEKMLVYAGLCLALASEAPVRIAAIGRLEAFDYEQKPKLVSLICRLVDSGKLDGAVMVNVQSNAGERFSEESDNLKVIIV